MENYKKKIIELLENKKVQNTIIVIVLVVGIFFIISKYVTANPDYICTKITPISGTCSNGAWGDWVLTSENEEEIEGEDYLVKDYKQIYTGTKNIEEKIEYYSRRVTCSGGFDQKLVGNTGGNSGFHEDLIFTVSGEACEIEKTKTTHTLIDPTDPPLPPLPPPLPSGECVYLESDCDDWNLLYTTSSEERYKRLCSGKTEITNEDCEKEEFKTITITSGEALKLDLGEGFECSLDQIEWNDCSKLITFIHEVKPIYLRVLDNYGIEEIEWSVDDNVIGSLEVGQSRGSFYDNKIENPILNLELGSGNLFEKTIILGVKGETINASGTLIQRQGYVEKVLNIRFIESLEYIEI